MNSFVILQIKQKKKLSLKVRKSASNFFGDSLLPMITMQVSSDSVDSLF